MKPKEKTAYDDIIHLPHHVSTRRKQMSLRDRAAQFAPFAALTGHDEAVLETARLTQAKIQLDENEFDLLDQKLHDIEAQPEPPVVEITYFLPDQRKSGGLYIKHEGRIKKFNQFNRSINMDNGLAIPIEDILKINIKAGE